MKTPPLFVTVTAAAATFAVGGTLLSRPSMVAAAAAPPTPQAPVTVTVPAPPVMPRTLSFTQELTGRRLYFAARDSYRNAASTAFSANWVLSIGNVPTKPTVVSGMETVYAVAAERKLSLDSTSTQPNRKTVRRAISNGQEMIVTQFEERTASAGTPPTREFVRVPLDEATPISRALQQAQFRPVSHAAQFLLDINTGLRPTVTLWRESRETLGGVSAEVVAEQERPTGRGAIQTRRYWIQPESKRLLRCEEWTTTQTAPRAARRNIPADNGARVTYRREDYTYLTKPATAAMWSQVLPANYSEKPLPETRLPALPSPLNSEAMNPKALTLLKKWRTAQERFLSYSATVDMTFNAVPRTAQSRPLPPGWTGSASRFFVTWRRPAQTRIEAIAVAKGGIPNVPESLLAVADGSKMRVKDRDRNRVRTVDIENPGALWNYLNRAGFNDGWGALTHLYTQPPIPENFESIRYEGPATTPDGELVEVITLTQQNTNTNRRRNQTTENLISTRIALAADGMPREMTIKREGSTPGMFERDQPPVITFTARYRNVRIDGEPSSTAFILPQP